LAVGAVLVATQSRSAWIGAAGGLGALVVLAGVTAGRGWVRVATAGLALLAAGGAIGTVLTEGVPLGTWSEGEIVFGPGSPEVLGEVVGRISLAGRTEIWSRALYVVQDFPFTGCGLGAFSKVVPILYPLFRVAPNADVGHAHNIFLQTAADVGLPGLIAYIAMLMGAGALCWRAARGGDGATRSAALGLAGGLVALHTYGLTDAMALGTKPAVVFWIALGLTAGLGPVLAAGDGVGRT
jgi:putative inorganic carbon (HCO3(-)) transporter